MKETIMQKIVVLIVFAVFIFGGCSSSQSPVKPVKPVEPVKPVSSDELKAKIEDLIQQLGDDDWRTREEVKLSSQS